MITGSPIRTLWDNPSLSSSLGGGLQSQQSQQKNCASHDGIIVADANGLVIYANRPAQYLFTTGTNDCIGRRMSDVLAPVLSSTHCHAHTQANAETLTEPMMFTDVCALPKTEARASVTLPLDVCMTPLTDTKGNKQGFGYIFTYPSEEEAHKPNALADRAHTPDYNLETIIFHDRGIIVEMAGAFGTTFGCEGSSPTALRGERINILFPSDTLRALGKAILSGDAGTKNGVALRRDGLLVPIEFRTLSMPCRGHGIDIIKVYAIAI